MIRYEFHSWTNEKVKLWVGFELFSNNLYSNSTGRLERHAGSDSDLSRLTRVLELYVE